MKNKEKLALIDDYIKIVQILKFVTFVEKSGLNTSRAELVKKEVLLALKLKCVYDQMFDRLKMNDISMKILIKDLDDIDFLRFIKYINLDKKIEDYEKILDELNMKLPTEYNECITDNQNINI